MKAGGQRGAAVVEFALVCGLLLIFLVGIVEFGFLWLQASYIGNAAREGARVAAKISGSDIDAREAAAEQAVEAYLKSNFLFRDRNSCQPDDAGFPLNCAYAVNDPDFVVTTYTRDPEKSLSLEVDGDTITVPMAEITVTVKTHLIWEPLLWPLLSALLPGVDYDQNKLRQLTQTAAYAISG